MTLLLLLRAPGTAPPSLPAAATFVDDFTTADTGKWVGYGGSGVTVTGGQLSLAATGAYPTITSVNRYDLTGSTAAVQFVSPPAASNGSTQAFFEVSASSGNFLGFVWDSGGITSRESIGGTVTTSTVPYDAATMGWWRFRETAGTVYWETSGDGATWTARRSKAPGVPVTAVTFNLIAGNWNAAPTPGAAIFDNVNGGTAAPPAPAFTGSAALTGAGTVTAGGAPTVTGAAPLTGVGTLTRAGTPAVTRAAALSGSGALAAAVVVGGLIGAATLAGAGTLTAGGTPRPATTTALTGAGTLTAGGSAAQTATGAATLTGVGALTGGGSATQAATGTATLTGSGALTTTAAPAPTRTAALTGAGALTAGGAPTLTRPAALTGTGTLTAATTPRPTTTTTLTGAGTLTSAGAPTPTTPTALTGTGTLRAGARAIAWEDDFTGTAGQPPDPTRWNTIVGAADSNNELQYYTARPENVALDGASHLAITARREAYQGATWTSGRINTRTLYAPQYGRLEARLKVPAGQGLWPAFWAMGDEPAPPWWPASGEIDVLETTNDATYASGALHGGYTSDPNGNDPTLHWSRGVKRGIALADGAWHTVAAEWLPDAIHWFVDDRYYGTVRSSDLTTGQAWPFTHPFYLLLNMAVGGDMPGAPDTTTPAVSTMLVDYVRVYEPLTTFTPPRIALSDLQDSFTTVDNQRWQGYDTNVTVTGGALRITPAASYPTMFAVGRFDATESALFTQVPATPQITAPSASQSIAVQSPDDANSASLGYTGGGGLECSYVTGGTKTSTYPARPAGTRFWRLRYTAGTVLWEVSPDAATWQVVRAAASTTTFDLTQSRVLLQAGHWDAADDTTAATDRAVFESVNMVEAPPATAGTAALSGGGSLTTTGAPAVARAGTLTGSGALTAAGAPAPTRAAALSGSGTLTTTTTPRPTRTTNLTGAGTLTTTTTPTVTRPAPLTGSGALTAVGSATQPSAGGVNLTGAGQLAVAYTARYTGAAALTGAGALTTPTRTPKATGTAILTGAGQLTATTGLTQTGVAALTGHGALTAEPVPAPTGAATLTGAGTLVAVGRAHGAARDITVTVTGPAPTHHHLTGPVTAWHTTGPTPTPTALIGAAT